ncbi:hypothetical protein F442_18361 [Phytophthora nicotianae P10297]|uniref:Amino acid transporter transmembrane domain-containing protein n=1 Tax=Phytophthora nicotianae P10297 TaxID=1317064 RepID=W2YDH8_PHYNI|nr:hypothetical protein F442_18361 [Phytophthora nicotianae P10297]
MNSILLPTVFYRIKTWERIAIYKKVAAGTVIVTCYIMYTAVYYNYSAVHLE